MSEYTERIQRQNQAALARYESRLEAMEPPEVGCDECGDPDCDGGDDCPGEYEPDYEPDYDAIDDQYEPLYWGGINFP